MKYVLFISILLVTIFCSACTLTPELPPDDWRGVCDLQPIIVTNAGYTSWTDEEVSKQTQWLDKVYAKAGLRFNVLPTKRSEKSWIFYITETSWIMLIQDAETYATEEHSLAVHFVQDIEISGMIAGGLSSYPSNESGWQHGIAISHVNAIDAGQITLAHELGHSFNVPHPWEDKYTDTVQTDVSDCVQQVCNIMNYCFKNLPVNDCSGQSFTGEQIEEIRRWANGWPRNLVVTQESESVQVFGVPEYTDRRLPIVDPPFLEK